ncbi:MAG: sigma-70 family RNA polymerase sigma factor [Dehalococcoidia bacterium]|nr:sigma-70 family RNA polymerase sigma factor [Dehalococcoidia bacterium]
MAQPVMALSDTSERDWVRAAKSGDRVGMESLLAAHSQKAFRFALQILRNQADAEDAAQSAFIKAFTKIDQFDESRSFGPWLMGIVSHEALNLRRATNTRFAFWKREAAKPLRSEAPAESIVMVRAEHEELWEAINRLKDDDRIVLILSYLVGMNEAETAEALGIKRGTVKSRKFNALRRLRSIVERDFPTLTPDALAGVVEDEQPRLEAKGDRR